MDKSSYIKNLVSLYESTKLNEAEIDPAQAKIADNGQDVVDGSIDQNEYVPDEAELNNSQMEDGMAYPEEDMSYLSQDSTTEDKSNEVNSSVSEDKKLLRLYNLFNDLSTYVLKFKESLDFIDISLLEDEDAKLVYKYIGRVNNISEKISDYISLSFSRDKYEKVLYTYILLRTEFLTILNRLRDILKLDSED